MLCVLLIVACAGPQEAPKAGAPKAGAQPDAPTDARPNIVFLFTDDHCTQAISAYGSYRNQTPNIDRLATGGMRFDNCFVTNAICGPSRAVILTGAYSHRNGFYRNGNKFDGSQWTFPKEMQRAGYETAIIGKWHLGTDPQGFDHWDILPGQGHYYNPVMRRNGERRKIEGYSTDVTTDLALEWLKSERDSEKPFVLMCQYKAPHRPWQPGPEHLTRYDDVTVEEPATLFDDGAGRGTAFREQEMTIATHLFDHDLKFDDPGRQTPEQRAKWDAAYGPKNRAFEEAGLEGEALVRWKYQRYVKDYLRCIDSVDEQIGRILDHLEASGLAENTIVVYSSDQGWYLGEHGWYDKRWMYEESLRTPLLVRWPGVTKAGSTSDAMVSNVDFASTFLEMAGASDAIPESVQGESFAAHLRGESTAPRRESFYYHYYEKPGPHNVAKHCGVRTERYKLIHFYRLDEWEMYDLDRDPDEMRSVADDPAYAAIRRDLEAELTRLQRDLGEANPEAPVPGDPDYVAPEASGG